VLTVPRLFPTPPAKRPVATQQADSARKAAAAPAPAVAGADSVARPPVVAAPTDTGAAAAGAVAMPDTVSVSTGHATYSFSTVGATPVQARMDDYESQRDKRRRVTLARDTAPLLRFALVAGGDTVPLSQMPFAVDSAPGTAAGRAPLTFRAPIGPASEAVIQYAFTPNDYLLKVSGQVTGAAPGAKLLVTMPTGMRSEEADTLDDIRHLAYVVKPTKDEARSIEFAKTDTLRAQTETDGPYAWVASKNKYFVVALMAPDSTRSFDSVRIAPAPRTKKAQATDVAATASYPLNGDGRFAFDVYAGPQEWRRLNALGRELEHVNPVGGWFKGIIQPFATAMMRLLLWLHATLQLNYGWVLIIFGILVRLVLWPLNQSAMRSNMRMQALQPELQALQKRYANDPQKQQQEVMLLYKKHGMNPLSPVLGCVPMLIPMPFLIALFYVFQNTIEFRGVPFLWLSDISQKDPYYILPIVMGLSMYLLSWIGMRNQPPNPQAKMLAYMMPVMMTFFLLNLASGLNLYYAVQNFAAMPQQWLLARERIKTGGTTTPASAPARS
jgi:YidC/Oxa1 family membrane protein insertase